MRISGAMALLVSLSFLGCSIDGRDGSPTEAQMRSALETMLVSAALAAGKKEGVANPEQYADVVLVFKKRECVPIGAGGSFFCSYDAAIQAKVPQGDGSVKPETYGGVYQARFDFQNGLWMFGASN